MSFRSEFQLRKFGFSDIGINDVCGMKNFCISSGWILLYRYVATLYVVIVMILSALYHRSPRWFIFLTNWNFILNTFYFIAVTIMSAYHWLNVQRIKKTNQNDLEQEDSERRNVISTEESDSSPSFFVGTICVLMETSMITSIIVVLLFWIILSSEIEGKSSGKQFVSISRHGINLLLLLLDFMFHRIPIRVLHFVYTLLFGVLYVVMSVVYCFTTTNHIYGKFIDWYNNPTTTVVTVLATFAAIFLIHFALYGLHRLKVALYGR